MYGMLHTIHSDTHDTSAQVLHNALCISDLPNTCTALCVGDDSWHEWGSYILYGGYILLCTVALKRKKISFTILLSKHKNIIYNERKLVGKYLLQHTVVY